MLSKRKKTTLVSEHKTHATDTGSAEVQIALLTARIKELADHLKSHPKDNDSRRGLLKIVGKRKKLADYLEKTDHRSYASLARKLGLK